MSFHALNVVLCINTGWARYGRERRERHGWTPRIKGNMIYTSTISTHLSLVISIFICFKHVTYLLSESLILMCHNHTGRQRRNGRTRTTRTHGISISQSVNPLNHCYESSLLCSADVVDVSDSLGFLCLCLRAILVKRAWQAPQTSLTLMGSFSTLSRWIKFDGAIVYSIRHLLLNLKLGIRENLKQAQWIVLFKKNTQKKLIVSPFLLDRPSAPSVFR